MKNWSDRQNAVFDTYAKTNQNIVIEATAGSGKTTTIVECCRRTAPYKKCFFSAFNKSIAEELKTRLPERVEVSTFHSKGLKVLLRNFNFKLKLSENKCFKIGRQILNLKDVPEKQQLRYLFELQDIWNAIRMNLLVDYQNDINNICIDKDIEFRDRMVQDIIDIEQEWMKGARKINNNRDFEMDFTDMLYLPYILVDEDEFPKYDLVVADEVQDMNTIQRELLLRYIKPIGGRFIAVGDPRQCQPEGTMVLMSNGKEKDIKDIKIGDTVSSYNIKAGFFTGISKDEKNGKAKGYRVLNKSERFADELYEIELENGLKSKYTPEHLCYARFNQEKSKDCYILYLMCNELGMYRIGVTKLYNEKSQDSFGLRFRMRLENCTKGWILNIYQSKRDAIKAESIYSYKFGIPQLTFNIERSTKNSFLKNQDIYDIYNEIGSLQENVLNCLSFFDKRYDRPFCKRSDDKHFSRNHIFEVSSCNLFPNYMDMDYFDKNEYYQIKGCRRYSSNYSNILSIKKKMGKIRVYSLDIDVHHNYIADGILTHNCIYSFQGADVSNFKLLQNLNNTVTLPLDITYRCAKSIVDEAKTVFSNGIEASENAIQGCVRLGELKEANPGDFVLCRNNLPLVEAFINLLQNSKKATIKDKDFGNALCAILDKITNFRDLEILKKQKIQELMDKGMSRASAIQQPSYENLVEKCSIIDRLSSIWDNISIMEENIKRIYTEDVEGIVLSTIHKSKGLESDRVFFLNPGLIPSDKVRTQEALYSEYCLKFVAITRAKRELIYCSI